MNINANDMYNVNNSNILYRKFSIFVIIFSFLTFYFFYSFIHYNFTSFFIISINKMGPRANKNTSRARITEKLRRQWNARKKLAITMYYEKGHSKNKTATKFNIQTKQVCD